MRPKKGPRADIRRTMTRTIKGEETQLKERQMSIKVPNAAELVGDGNANISRTRTIKMAVPDSFGTSISASCTVGLTCNQDNKTINKTAKLCTSIIEKLMEVDQDEMANFVEAMR